MTWTALLLAFVLMLAIGKFLDALVLKQPIAAVFFFSCATGAFALMALHFRQTIHG